MNELPTPETDQFKVKLKTICGEKYWVPVEHSERLERERDEAREAAAAWENKWKCAVELAANYSLEREHNAMQALAYKAELDRARLNLYEEAAK